MPKTLGDFPRVRPGDRFRPNAGFFNATADVIRDHRRAAAAPGETGAVALRNDVVRVRNLTDGVVERGQVLGIGGTLFPFDNFLDEAAVEVRIALPTDAWGIANRPMGPTQIGEIITDGITTAQVRVVREHHRFCDVDPNAAETAANRLLLRSAPIGSARMLWVAPVPEGTTPTYPRTAWAIVKMHAAAADVEYQFTRFADPAAATGLGFASAMNGAIYGVPPAKFGAADEAMQEDLIFASTYSGNPADGIDWLDLSKCQPALRRGARFPVVQREYHGLALPCCAWPFLRAGCSD